MNFYIISYDLKVPGRDYSPLYNEIKELGEWQHPLESTWIVATVHNENDIYNRLKPVLDTNDLLLIFKVVPGDHQGWLAKSFWEWMRTKISEINDNGIIP